MSPPITRRGFLKLGLAGTTAAVFSGCQPSRRLVNLEPYVRPPEEQLAGVATWYASTCRQCPAGCGIVVRVMNGRALKIEGNPEHPLNRGKLCARGQAGLQLLYNPDRLAGPVRQVGRGSRQFESLSWTEAISTLSSRLQEVGSNVAVWGGSTMSGHLYDLFRRLMQAIGAPEPVVFDLYSGLQGYDVLRNTQQTLTGTAALPSYDLRQADVILSLGANFLSTGTSAVRYGVEYGDFRSQPLGKRGYLVQVEPRMSITGAVADRWVSIRPGSEALVAQGILRLIADQELGPAERVAQAQALAADVDVEEIATTSDISVQELQSLANLFVTAERPVVIPGATQVGQDGAAEALTAAQLLNVVAGTVAQPGGMIAPSGPAPQGLAQPVTSSFAAAKELIGHLQNGEIQVLLVHGANPAFDLPPDAGFEEAVRSVPLVVSFSPMIDETAVMADMVLPDRTYLEAWGYEIVTPDFGLPVVGSQQPVVTPVFDSRSTADLLLACASGIPVAAQALPWADEVACLQEVVAQLPPGAAGGSAQEVRWARFLQHGGWWPASPPATSPPQVSQLTVPAISAPSFQGDVQDYPYFLHLYLSDLLSDGRGASQPWLQGSPDPMTTIAWQSWVELNPTTAQLLGVVNGDIVRVVSLYGEIKAPVVIYPAIRPDTVAMPLGQGHTDFGRFARDRGSNPMQLVSGQIDTADGNLAWATLRVQIAPTGGQVDLAVLENTGGVTDGFINQSQPS